MTRILILGILGSRTGFVWRSLAVCLRVQFRLTVEQEQADVRENLPQCRNRRDQLFKNKARGRYGKISRNAVTGVISFSKTRRGGITAVAAEQ
jgi:hypothetical protein